ncbi:hypothetical protein ACSDR0_39390 [Streptosporangium sp. G11]|uniref:hypothetical protein n=1 Tax=Streptosporangium sp. G11 TaxID=3436926 RepID=UPI003EBE7C8E
MPAFGTSGNTHTRQGDGEGQSNRPPRPGHVLGFLRGSASFVKITSFDLFITNSARWDIWGARNPILGGRAGDAMVVKPAEGAMRQPLAPPQARRAAAARRETGKGGVFPGLTALVVATCVTSAHELLSLTICVESSPLITEHPSVMARIKHKMRSLRQEPAVRQIDRTEGPTEQVHDVIRT